MTDPNKFMWDFLLEAAPLLNVLTGSKRDRLEDYMEKLLNGEQLLTYGLRVEEFLKRRW